jgi:hypothetical protein
MTENRMLRRIFGPKREEVEDEMGGACSTHGRDEICIQNFGRKT